MNDKNDTMSLGECLRSQREAHSFSQETLAQKLHVTRQTISGWERGRSEPDISCLQNIAEIYGMTIDNLLYNVVIEQPCETHKRGAFVFLLIGLMLTGGVTWGNVVQGNNFLPSIICGAYCIIVNLIIWTAFSSAIKTGDVGMLAGYDSKLNYHLPTLKRVLDAQRFWIILSTVIACMPFSATMFWPIKIGFGVIIFICALHIVSVIVGLIFIDHKFGDSLFMDSSKAWIVKASNIPLFLFIGSMILTLIIAAIKIELFEMQNNTPTALLFALILTSIFIVQIVCFVIDMQHNRQLTEQSKRYTPKRGAVIGYIICVLLSILLLAI